MEMEVCGSMWEGWLQHCAQHNLRDLKCFRFMFVISQQNVYNFPFLHLFSEIGSIQGKNNRCTNLNSNVCNLSINCDILNPIVQISICWFSKIPQGGLASSLVRIPKMAHFFSGYIWEEVLKQSIYSLIHFRIMKYMMFFLLSIKCWHLHSAKATSFSICPL